MNEHDQLIELTRKAVLAQRRFAQAERHRTQVYNTYKHADGEYQDAMRAKDQAVSELLSAVKTAGHQAGA